MQYSADVAFSAFNCMLKSLGMCNILIMVIMMQVDIYRKNETNKVLHCVGCACLYHDAWCIKYATIENSTPNSARACIGYHGNPVASLKLLTHNWQGCKQAMLC